MGVYGNRKYSERKNKEFGNKVKLSIIRDLVSIRPGDIILFHIRGRKEVHGVYQARSYAFYEETKIWNDSLEMFPYRFLFKPHPEYYELASHDAYTDVASVYELIDRGQIQSLITLEFERNIERRSVRRIFVDDALKIIKLLYRDFRKKFLDH